MSSSQLGKSDTPRYNKKLRFRYGHDRIVELLLKKGSNSILTDKDGYSPLHLAVESQNLVSLKLLLADIRAKLTPSGKIQFIRGMINFNI